MRKLIYKLQTTSLSLFKVVKTTTKKTLKAITRRVLFDVKKNKGINYRALNLLTFKICVHYNKNKMQLIKLKMFIAESKIARNSSLTKFCTIFLITFHE